jgi:hypothetical protein
MELHEGQAHLAKIQLIVLIIVFSIGILTLIGINIWDIKRHHYRGFAEGAEDNQAASYGT